MDGISRARQAIKVVIADSHAAVREGLRALLSFMPDLNVVGIAEHGTEAVELARRNKPDVVLMDLGPPLREGIKATERIVGLLQGSKVVWFSFEDDDDTVIRLMEAGASGFVSKQDSPGQVLEAIREVSAGRPYFRREIPRIPVKETRLVEIGPATAEASARQGVKALKRET